MVKKCILFYKYLSPSLALILVYQWFWCFVTLTFLLYFIYLDLFSQVLRVLYYWLTFIFISKWNCVRSCATCQVIIGITLIKLANLRHSFTDISKVLSICASNTRLEHSTSAIPTPHMFHLCNQVWLLFLSCCQYVYYGHILNTHSTMVHIFILHHFRHHKYELFNCYILVKQYVALVYHLDDHIVVYTVVSKVAGPGNQRSKDIRSDCDRHIIWSHLIEGLILHDVPEKFDMKVQGVKVERIELINQFFEIRKTLWFIFLPYLAKLLIHPKGDQGLLHLPQQPLPVICDGMHICYLL